MKNLKENIDLFTFLVASITLVLFVVALFTKELLHDIIIEAAIFLISMKLILSMYKQSVISKRLEKRIMDIDSKIDEGLKK